MSALPLYVSAFLTGLAGGFAHCIGMCGVFVVAYAGLPDKGTPRRLHPERHLLFHAGRLVSFAVLGLLGGAISALGHRWATLQGAISLTVGVVMIGLALGVAGIVPWLKIPEPDVMGAGGGVVRRLFVRALQSRGRVRPLLIGLFVGLLPCGLTYAELIATPATFSPLGGALLMLAFGLGTVPGLLALALFGNALFGGLLSNLRFRRAMTCVAAAFMAVLGLAFILRALPNIG